jgi:hypothetical protein
MPALESLRQVFDEANQREPVFMRKRLLLVSQHLEQLLKCLRVPLCRAMHCAAETPIVVSKSSGLEFWHRSAASNVYRGDEQHLPSSRSLQAILLIAV